VPVFVTGASGYIGRHLIAALVESGVAVKALVRPGSAGRLPPGADPVIGDALDSGSFAHAIPRGATLVHLVGTPHPAPWKNSAFRSVDLTSGLQAIAAAEAAAVSHFVYLSVAQPAPVMAGYLEVRQEVESRLASSGMPATILRPWYVTGPGHHWPLVLIPAYAIAERLPWTREAALRLGLVTIQEMTSALVSAICAPKPLAATSRIITVPQIRTAGVST
jgi:uncharacterized protein YbjT (DUF2867 family)